MKLDILFPERFPKDKVIAGVTKRNYMLFPPYGFSVHKADIYTEQEAAKHREILARQLNVSPDMLKCNKQVHGTTILEMKKNSMQKVADGMFCREKGVIIYTKIADCTGILIYDPINCVVAALHSGWKGSKLNIVNEGINTLQNECNSNPSDLIVFISPAASGKNYEVEWDVAQFFPDYIEKISDKKYLFDNKACIYNQLIECGIQEYNIEVSDICTIENTDYHSFRRDKEKSGRMAAFIGLKQPA